MDAADKIETSKQIVNTIESTFAPSSVPVVPPWERKKHWKFWTPIINQYHGVIDDPNKLPTLLQPLLSKEREFTFGNERPSYFNFEVQASDEYGVHRRLYINLCKENLMIGALGAVLVGLGTRHYTLSQSRLHSFVAKRMFLGNPVSSSGRKMLTVPNVAAIGTKVVIRSVTGGFMYDVIKRSREEKNMDNMKKVTNAGLAGAICGFLFGLRGGLPQAWAAGFLNSAGTAAVEFLTTPGIHDTQKPTTNSFRTYSRREHPTARYP